MGNKNNKTPATRAAQAPKVQISGEGQGGGAGGRGNGPVPIRIKLVQLDISILSLVSLEDVVDIDWNGIRYSAFFKGQRLGNVPTVYEKRLLPTTNYRGVVVEALQQPPSVIVELAM